MWRTNLKVAFTVLITLGVYTGVSNVIPQVESEVPERVEIGADVSVEELVTMGEELFEGAGGCVACHGLGTRAPQLRGEIGRRCGERRPEMSCKEYLHESLVDPGAYVVEGFQPIMPSAQAQLSGGQVWALVAFLQSQGGEVTVTPADLEAAARGGGQPAAGGEGPAAGGEGDARALVKQYGCMACHRLGGQGGVTAPPFEEMRQKGLSPEYVRRSIVEPNVDTASGYSQDYGQFAGTMPPNFGETMSDGEIQAVVDFLTGGGEDGGSDDQGEEQR